MARVFKNDKCIITLNNNNMYPSKIDVPVLMIFFARQSTFKRVFAAVREARPSTLLLWQDGPRPNNNNDIKGIEACRKIVEDGIDWECKVYKQYHDENMGCDPSTFNAHKWAFTVVEKCIVLEDDQLPNQSFFHFCKELLDYYENDNRINHINGYNLVGVSESCPYDYFFHTNGTGAWASWRRVAKGWEEDYAFLHDGYAMKNLKYKRGKKLSLHTALWHEATGKAYWETILGMDCLLNNRYAIIPKKNLVSNVGLTEGSTHSSTEFSYLSRDLQKIFQAKTYDLEFPLKHPKYIIEDADYAIESYKLVYPDFMDNLRRNVIYYGNCLIHGDFERLMRPLKNLLKK